MKSSSPIGIEVTRGDSVESVHKVHAVIADASGSLRAIHGEREFPVFPRSAIKALQALPLIESGAADTFGFERRHLALACSSHNGEPMHAATATEMLERAGLDATCLECGAQLPYHPRDYASMVRDGIEPGAIHNNCSGKHSGFLAFAAHQGIAVRGYVNFGHEVQKIVAGTLEAVTGAPHREDNHGIDGCSIPTYSMPLDRLAIAYARFGIGEDQSRRRAEAMTRLRDACFAHPEMVAGTERACTLIMQALPGRAFVKTGAEGVFTASLPELGLGIALKCEDGTTRAAEATVASLIESLLEETDSGLSPLEASALKRFSNQELRNRNNLLVGHVRIAR